MGPSVYVMAHDRCIDLDHADDAPCSSCVDYMARSELDSQTQSLRERVRELEDQRDLLAYWKVMWEDVIHADTKRLDWLFAHAFEIVAKIPGGIHCIESRDDIDAARRGEG